MLWELHLWQKRMSTQPHQKIGFFNPGIQKSKDEVQPDGTTYNLDKIDDTLEKQEKGSRNLVLSNFF